MKLAIFPSSGLGDGVIQLVLAQNLAKLGISVDYYHHFLADINEFIEAVDIYKPSRTILDAKIETYDVVLQDSGSKQVNLSHYHQKINSSLAVYSMSREKQNFFGVPKNNTKNSKFVAPVLVIDGKQIDFSLFNGRSLRTNNYSSLSTAGCIVHFLKSNKLLDKPDYELNLTLPNCWQKQKYKKRILIHPTSGNEKKNWLPDRFISLARNLSAKGYNPIFTLATDEKENWDRMINHEFEIPVFKSNRDLARYYYESALLIGTDSGNGHLASALALPTITIVNRYSNPFPWRPNWSNNIIIRPFVSKKLIGNHYWKHTVSEKLILESVKQILP